MNIEDRIKEIALAHCADYPNIETVQDYEKLWAIEQTLEGKALAIGDLHDKIGEILLRLKELNFDTNQLNDLVPADCYIERAKKTKS